MAELTIEMLQIQIADAESHGMICDMEKQLLATMQREAKLIACIRHLIEWTSEEDYEYHVWFMRNELMQAEAEYQNSSEYSVDNK